LYPVVTPSGAALPVLLGDDDGAVRDLTARSLTIRTQRDGHVRERVAVRRGGVDVLVTDSRVILAGARQPADSLLAGHIRLDWIVAVGGCTERGVFRGDALRLVLQFDNGDYSVVTLSFDSDLDVHELAQDIARRTAARWLATHVAGPLTERWSALASVARQSAEHGEFALIWMPSHARVIDPALTVGRLGVPA
jgi:hypothetical protein